MKKQAVKKLELAKTKVTYCSSRVTLLANNTNSYVSLFNHSHIVASITNSQHYRIHVLLDKFNYFSFFFGRTAAEDNWFCLFQYFYIDVNIMLFFLLNHLSYLLTLDNDRNRHIFLDILKGYLCLCFEISNITCNSNYLVIFFDQLG